ncbi:MAG TPA: DUF952 domain-containing protein [Candidatus Cybelea sp.]|nr:DUF952 domain-containing protein [Candidatus Cybelea sp.]
MTTIYHMADRDVWAAATARGTYSGTAADAADGFMHFSTAAQVEESAAKHRKGAKNLVLLEVDAEVLGTDLRWETARGGDLFPHLYAALDVRKVRAVHDLPLGPGGQHIFPVLMP